MKHIWKSSKEHATGSLDVTEDMSSFTPDSDLGTEFSFQINDSGKKHIPVRWCIDLGNLKEDFSKPAGVGCSGQYAAPGQALPLYMDQAALHDGIRPELTDNAHHLLITIHGEAVWAKTRLFQTGKVSGKLWGRIFRNTVPASNKRVCLGIHQSNQAVRPVQESTVKNEMMVMHQIRNRFWRRLYQIAVNHTVKLPRAIAALVGQLPDRITFDNPKSKQFLLFGIVDLVTPTFPTSGVPANSTEPALFSSDIMTVSPKNACTERA